MSVTLVLATTVTPLFAADTFYVISIDGLRTHRTPGFTSDSVGEFGTREKTEWEGKAGWSYGAHLSGSPSSKSLR